MFTKDTRTENFLSQMGVSFRYTNTLTFAELKAGWDKHNLARPVPLRDEAVLEYAALMESGSAAPAPIVHVTENGVQILDGVQRIMAAKLANGSKISAYIVTSDSDDLLTAVRVLANARLQGHQEPPEWTRKTAVQILVLERGLTINEVARMGGWRPADIETTARILGWGFTIRSIGGPLLPDKMLDLISRNVTETELREAPKTIANFLNILKQSQFSTYDAEPFVRQFFAPVVKAKHKHDIYSDRLDQIKGDPEVQVRLHGRRRSGLSADVRLRKALKSAHTVLEEIYTNGDELLYADEFFRILKAINKQLRSVAKHNRPDVCETPAESGATVNKLKKAILELQSHLGRDNRGLSLLDEVRRHANEIRKHSADLQITLDGVSEHCRRFADTLLQKNEKINTLQQELQREKTLLQQRERDVTSWMRKTEELQVRIDKMAPNH